ncbi:MAG: hypothetical protein GF350_13240 [Chitinivibrionales bacterium]|nr:hypothetical protein [Chitinivibrionales bacterium]
MTIDNMEQDFFLTIPAMFNLSKGGGMKTVTSKVYRLKRCAGCFGLLLLLWNYSQGSTYYVAPNGSDNNPGTESAPFQTLTKARDYLRSIGPAGNTVVVRGGDYFLSEPLAFNEQDGGTEQAPVVWKNYPNEEPRIFGGTKITGWQLSKGNIYRAKLELPSSANIDTMGWTLSENGRRSPPARNPNVFTGKRHGFFSSLGDMRRREVIYDAALFPSDWKDDFHCRDLQGATGWFSQLWPVKNVDFANRQIFHDPDIKDARGSHFIEGAVEFIDLPGEWAVAGDGYVYCWPKKTPVESQTIVIGHILRIIEFKGASGSQPVQHLTIDGLTISTSDCTYRGLSNKQTPTDLSDGTTANCDSDYSRHGAIHLENAEHITITNCKVLNAGVMAIMLNYHAKYNRIYGNWIEGVNYHGICLESYCGETGPWDYINCYNTIQNNYIYRTGRSWSNGAGIYLHQSGNNLIAQNEIREMPRYGITMKGIMWLYGPPGAGGMRGDFCANEVQCGEDHIFVKRNVIRHNDISHVINSTNDCGAFECWNIGPYDSVFQNLVHDVYHPTIDVRCYEFPEDPAAAGSDFRTGGLSHRHGIYPDGAGKGTLYAQGNVNYNIVSGAQTEAYGQKYTICRSAAKVIAQQHGMEWDQVGLRSDFKWYGRTPGTDTLEEEVEFPEELVHDPEYIDEYMKRFNNGSGLTATYFSDANFGTQTETVIDPLIVKNWLAESPTGTDQWSVRWEGYVVPIKTEQHRFGCVTDKDAHCQIWINGKLVLDDNSWRTQPGDKIRVMDSLTETLEMYSYVPIKIELSSAERQGYFKLEWYGRTSLPSMPVMTTQLYPKNHDISKPPEMYGGGAAVAQKNPAVRHNELSPGIAVAGKKINLAFNKAVPHTVRLIGINGAVIRSINLQAHKEYSIDIGSLAAGVYMIVLDSHAARYTQKITFRR